MTNQPTAAPIIAPTLAGQKRFNVVVATDLTEESLLFLRAASDVSLQTVPPQIPAVREQLKTAHALIARDDLYIDADMLNTAANLKLIARLGIGLNNLDIETATQRGIIVMNTPGSNALAAGEHTLALLLALSRRLVTGHNSLKEGWWLLDRTRQAGTQLEGKTLGIVGYGRVGHIVATRALAFNMTVLAYDPYVTEEQVEDPRIALVDFTDLLSRSDFVSIHVATTRETENLFDEEVLHQMKRGARLINTSHGSVLDEDALVKAIKEGHLAGAAVDVYREVPPYHSPLIGMDSVIHTPHIGDNTIEATQDQSMQVARQTLDALHDTDYRNVVNMPLVPGHDFDSIRPYLKLAEAIGILQQNIARSPIRRVEVEYRGEELSKLVKPLTVALLKGMLSPVLGDKVNYVNAPILASERGIQVTQTKGLKTGDYTNLISCRVLWESGGELVMAGAPFDRRAPRIVLIDEYPMDFVPEGHLLIMGSYDRPGVIGKVGTLLANNNINIANWRTGRAQPGGNTLTVITLDEFLPEAVLTDLLAQDYVRHAIQIEIQ